MSKGANDTKDQISVIQCLEANTPKDFHTISSPITHTEMPINKFTKDYYSPKYLAFSWLFFSYDFDSKYQNRKK